ncbi:hypothetical protein CL617_00520 [archaeon]|nr:hypothetical protein [archaeon]
MATKDWKKAKGQLLWYKDTGKSTGKEIHITKLFYQEEGKYALILDNLDWDGRHNLGNTLKKFKTKSQALKFAKSYMRKH